MKIVIRDEDFNNKSIINSNPRIRIGARGIVIREDNKIAIFNKTLKNEYKLPGGGVDNNEDIKSAFKREVLEETGCEVKIIKKMGTVEENRTNDNFKQISHVFISRVIKDTKRLSLTKKENDEGGKLIGLDKNEALKLMKKSNDNVKASKYENLYHTKFIILRDIKILEEYIKNAM